MASLENITQNLLDLVDTSVEQFNSAMPELERQVYDDIARLVKDLDLKGDRLANTVKNIKAIGTLKARIEKIVLNKDYVSSVSRFARAFNGVAELQNEYFSQLSSEFGPSKLLDAIRQQSVESAVTSLTEAGITSSVTKGIQDILLRNITGGGSYSAILEQMRNYITTNDTGNGALLRYAKQITTDSLNQFSARYTQTIADDLGFEWYMYVGSNLKTTRKFCTLLTKKKYIHKSELPDIVRGIIDGVQVPINPTTKTWGGGIPGTNVENFQVNRGGYGCGHQLLPVAATVIPQEIRMRFAA